MSSFLPLCRAASDLHSEGRVFLVLASVVEFRSTINEIDRTLTRFPLLHHMAFVMRQRTALASLLHERVDMMALTKDRRLQYIIDLVLCPQPYCAKVMSTLYCGSLRDRTWGRLLENSTTSNVISMLGTSFLQLSRVKEDHEINNCTEQLAHADEVCVKRHVTFGKREGTQTRLSGMGFPLISE